MNYYLGIDGGGTRTTAAVSDESGKILLKQTGKTINFYSVGMEESRKNLAEIIACIYEKLGEISFSAAFIGCSALDDEAGKALTQKLCGGVINADKIRMHSDVYIALRSVGEVTCPCAAICGTGSMAIAQDTNGKTHITGGWGHIVGDEGSGYSIAINAFRLCCEMCDKSENTPLLRKANEFFGINDFRKAIDIIYSPDTTKDILAGFARNVAKLAADGDTQAQSIVRSEALSFANTVTILLEKVKSCTVLGLYGGVFQHNSFFTNIFSAKVKESFPGIEIRLITTPPEESALTLARML